MKATIIIACLVTLLWLAICFLLLAYLEIPFSQFMQAEGTVLAMGWPLVMIWIFVFLAIRKIRKSENSQPKG